MKSIIITLLTLSMNSSWACFDATLENLTCKETLDSSEPSEYSVDKFIFTPTSAAIIQGGESFSVELPSTVTDEDGWVSSYGCLGPIFLITDSYAGKSATYQTKMTATGLISTGEVLVISEMCNEHNCEESVTVKKYDSLCEVN